ncbi:MAG: hypothetical protein STHCBS139747_004196 [Sporothrix thermara]
MTDVLNPIDAQTLAVAIELYLEDINDFKTHRKGKNRQDDITDEDLAMEAWQAELQAFSQLTMDRALCESIARAVVQDADLIGAAVQEDVQAAEDRNIALEMSGHGGVAGASSRTSTPAVPADLDDDLEAKLWGLNITPATQNDSWGQTALPAIAESSSAAAARSQRSRAAQSKPRVTCVACSDNYAPESTVRVPCGHNYCHECIKSLVTASIADESLFPPRCCNQPLPLFDRTSAPFKFLSAQLYAQFYDKKEEYETVDRTYCHVAACSRFLSARTDILADIGFCPDCFSSTCVICKGATHSGVCPEDTASQEVLRIARENGWQRCRGCKRLVELNTGCNHMNRLYARAEAVVGRNVNVHALDRADLLRRERDNLIENHECEHASWGSRQGRHRCEECNDTLPYFIYECRRCHVVACRRCRFNRL